MNNIPTIQPNHHFVKYITNKLLVPQNIIQHSNGMSLT